MIETANEPSQFGSIERDVVFGQETLEENRIDESH
jgi:hypothetical protein